MIDICSSTSVSARDSYDFFLNKSPNNHFVFRRYHFTPLRRHVRPVFLCVHVWSRLNARPPGTRCVYNIVMCAIQYNQHRQPRLRLIRVLEKVIINERDYVTLRSAKPYTRCVRPLVPTCPVVINATCFASHWYQIVGSSTQCTR